MSKAAFLLTFDQLFSSTVSTFLFSNDTAGISRRFGVADLDSLRNYLRFVVMNVAFGGLTTRRKARDLLFGYTDSLLLTLKELDPALGGDPSIDPVIHLNEINASREQARFFPQ